MKIVLKGCRRCGGDLFPGGDDHDGRTLACLQCGLSIRLVPASRSFMPARVPGTPPRPRAA